MKLEGIFIPVTTPFVEGQIATSKLASNLEKWNALDLDGYVVLGSTGEAGFLTPEEKLNLIKSAKENAGDEKMFIVGSGFESTEKTIEFTNKVADIGVNGALVLTPHYYKNQMTDETLRHHFISVADKSNIPIIIYNVPLFTGIDISAQVIKQLSSHPNIIGIKDSTNNFSKLFEIVENSSSDFNIIIGNAAHFLPGLFIGAHGAILALCNIAARECVQVYQNYQKGSYETARQLFTKLMTVVKEVITPYGIPAIKAAMDLLGYFGGEPRRPLLPVEDEIVAEIRQQVVHAELL